MIVEHHTKPRGWVVPPWLNSTAAPTLFWPTSLIAKVVLQLLVLPSQNIGGRNFRLLIWPRLVRFINPDNALKLPQQLLLR
jgi:hypothetical protein